MVPALKIEGSHFIDAHGRQVILRGINVSGDAKLPTVPYIPSRTEEHFFDGDSVSFVGRPFSLETTPEHFARLRAWGYDSVRYVFTWEALEHEGPGIYDEDFIQHTIATLRIAGEYGFRVFMDPHQDVWSRFSGGSGAPMWTLYACGLDPRTFIDNEAAVVHNTWPDKEGIPKMIWTTNYFRLACQVMFTMFWAGKDYTPKAIIDGKNIQDYLQDHLVAACQHLAVKIKEAGDLLDEVVIGWESLNEPNRGLIGWQDLTAVPRDQRLRRGTSPTPLQSILLASGRPQEVEVWEIKWNGPAKTGTSVVNSNKVPAWLESNDHDIKYGWTRDPGWKLGECIWAQHGIWDPQTDKLLKPHYFSKDPQNGVDADYSYFANRWLMAFYRKYRDALRSVHPTAIMICQGPTLEKPPILKGTADEDTNMASALHWYDGMTLLFKKWNSWYTMDIIGMMRGKYSQEWMAIKFGGAGVIKRCFRDQFIFMRQEVEERIGNVPVIFTETGSPYDLSDKVAYETGNYADQIASLDSVHHAIERSGISGYALWNYTEFNSHHWGDNWNNEDFSVYSTDDPTLPLKSLNSTPRDSVKDITKGQLVRTETMDMSTSSLQAEPKKGGFRAGEAHIRPWPLAVRGKIETFGFELDTVTFTLVLDATDATETDESVPTEIYLPEFHFPLDETNIAASNGSHNMSVEKGMRKLKWWHPGGKQTITIVGLKQGDRPKGIIDKAWDGVAACMETR